MGETMTNEEEIIYQYLDNVPRVVSDPSKKLREGYGVFNKKYFRAFLPHLSEFFICVFQDMPGDDAGPYIPPDLAVKLSTNETRVRPGIRINCKLKDFTPHVQIVLLHEMIHASGIEGHKEDFLAVIPSLVNDRVYERLL